MNITDIVTTKEAQNGFYPTPDALANQLFDMADLSGVKTVLEPSAGKGNLILSYVKYRNVRSAIETEVDAIEIDPMLRTFLSHEFSKEKEAELRKSVEEINKKRKYSYNDAFTDGLSDEEKEIWNDTMYEIVSRRKDVKLHIVHDDFMSYDTRKHYDLILMNPPFSEADSHLLKAIQMQEVCGGKVLCICNAETLLNPYSAKRKVLMNKLHSLDAKVNFVDDAFVSAERKTDVRVALIYVDIPEVKHESDIYNRLHKAQQEKESNKETSATELTVSDFIESIVSQYKMELDLGLALIDEYKALLPYLLTEVRDGAVSGCGLRLSVGSDEDCTPTSDSRNRYVNFVRKKYWTSIMNNPKFTGKLTENLRSKYARMVDSLVDYDFSVFNIQNVMAEMNAEMSKGVEETILALFDRLSSEYSWYPETKNNIHYYNGWKTNKAHCINKKVIIPCNGCFSDPKWHKNPLEVWQCMSTFSDIEKCLNYLDGNMTAEVDMRSAFEKAREERNYKNIKTKYFTVTLFKKGTAHLKFSNDELLKRFNIYACQHRNWLPPTYGKKQYADMTDEEKAVIDEFQGAEDYEKVMRNPSYYLSTKTNLLQIGE